MRGIVGLARRLAECLGEPGDHLRVDRIVLGQPSGRQREAANPLGIDNPHLDAGLAQHLGPVTLIAAARLHHRLVHLVLAKPGNQLAVTLRGVRERLPQCDSVRMHASTLSLATSMPDDNQIILCHHPLPSLLGTGSKPLQLFGLRKTPELSLALIQALSPLGATGSVPATGGWSSNRPFAHSARFQGHKGAGKTGCLLHPRSRVRFAQTKLHTSIQGSGTSGLPCAMALRLTSCSPRRTALLPPSPERNFLANLTPAPRRPNHTTSPYASGAYVVAPLASIASHRTFVTMANAPQSAVRRDGVMRLIWPSC